MSLTQKRKNGSLRFVEVEMIDNFFIKDPRYLFPPKFECFLFVCLLFFFFYNCWIVFFKIPWKFSSQCDKIDILMSIAGTYRDTDKGYGGKFVGYKIFKLDELWHSPFDSHYFFHLRLWLMWCTRDQDTIFLLTTLWRHIELNVSVCDFIAT